MENSTNLDTLVIKQFGIRLKNLLIDMKYLSPYGSNQIFLENLSTNVKCDLTDLIDYINGTKLPPFATIERLAKFIGVDCLWLYCGISETANDHKNEGLLKLILNKLFAKLLPYIYDQHPITIEEIINFSFSILHEINVGNNRNNPKANIIIELMIDSMVKEIIKKHDLKNTIALAK